MEGDRTARQLSQRLHAVLGTLLGLPMLSSFIPPLSRILGNRDSISSFQSAPQMEANDAAQTQVDETAQADSSDIAPAGADEPTSAEVEETPSRGPQHEAAESTSEGLDCNLCFLCFDTQEGGYGVEKVDFQWPERIVEKNRLCCEEEKDGSKTLFWKTIMEEQGSPKEVFANIRAAIYKSKGWWSKYLWCYELEVKEVNVSGIWGAHACPARLANMLLQFRFKAVLRGKNRVNIDWLEDPVRVSRSGSRGLQACSCPIVCVDFVEGGALCLQADAAIRGHRLHRLDE